MANIEILSGVLAEWLGNVASSVLPQVQIPQTSTIGRMMNGFLGIDLSTYNIYKELGFLVAPTIQNLVTPMMHKYLSAFPDEDIPAMAKQYAELFAKQASEQGSVNLFGIQLGPATFERLKELLAAKFV